MTLTKSEFSSYVKQFQFRRLFNEMGWNNDHTEVPITIDDDIYPLKAVAEKSGFKVLQCLPDEQNKIPPYSTRKKIETKVTKLFQEHLIIFVDGKHTEQLWQWVLRQSGKPAKVTETRYHISQAPELLYQRAAGIFFEFDEEENITIVDVTQRVEANFHQNNEKVTRKFYEQFKNEHTSFLRFIKGIEGKTDKDWYASLMLNRLMFCYFIQKKGFLDDNKNYLRDKLNDCKAKKGKNQFYSFYRNFLLVLFHKGLNRPERREAIEVEIGKVPYLNGGLFDEHELEKTYKDIDIDDRAFEKLFKFFDEYNWYLDTRHTATGNDINPDVIGYIFEKYINDRAQMGAYYTKEDITEYISKNCILPYLFDETRRSYAKAFAVESELWSMVRHSEDKYIYPAVKKGIDPEKKYKDLNDGDDAVWNDLPEDVRKGINPYQKDLVEKRKCWNHYAPEEIALPTEIYREVIARRKRYYEIREKIEHDEINHINDFISYNLDIRQLAQDAIENTTDPAFLSTFYKALNAVSILDPTCGSGAFLFAALNILEPLYEACIHRMENFVSEAPRGKYKFFADTLKKVEAPEHPNLQYFIYKSIILNNLYGVDIMREAVEIAKLRLFLKLVATVDADYRKPNLGLEPLPDIDFNIRAGNTLIGFATKAELEKGGKYTFDFDQNMPKIEEQSDVVAHAFKRYKEIQLTYGDDYVTFKKAKADLNKRLKELNHELNQLLYKQYAGIDYNKWLADYQPFHWFAEFYEIVHEKGGFDVIIGNPPYVELKVAEKIYKIKNPDIKIGGNLHSVVAARILNIITQSGLVGLIVPVAITNTKRMEELRKRLISKGFIWVSNYAIRPGKLFSGAEQRLSIYILKCSKTTIENLFSSKYYKWNKEERLFLFDNISLTNISISGKEIWVKLPNEMTKEILYKINNSDDQISRYIHGNHNIFYKNTGIGYYITMTLTPPDCYINGIKTSSSRETSINFDSSNHKYIFHSLFSSNTFFLFYHAMSNCRDLNPSDLNSFKFPESIVNNSRLIELSETLQNNLIENSWFQIRNQKQTGEVKIQSFTSSLAKPIIDEIDTVLAEHYGFTEEELDFIINYDIKYRMGKELEEEG